MFVTVKTICVSIFFRFPTGKKPNMKQLPNIVLKKDFVNSTSKRKTGINNYTVCGLWALMKFHSN